MCAMHMTSIGWVKWVMCKQKYMLVSWRKLKHKDATKFGNQILSFFLNDRIFSSNTNKIIINI